MEPRPYPAIRDLPLEERPRERALRYGVSSLTTAQLVALILGSGIPGESVVHVGERILVEMDGLAGLARADVEDLCRVKGVGPAKAVEVLAAVELGRRVMTADGPLKPVIRCSDDVARLMRSELLHVPHEEFRVLLLDTRNQVQRVQSVSIGTLNASLVHPREVFRSAVAAACASVIVVHNHPSGDPTPSPEDLQVTRQLVEAGKILGISVLDHVILGGMQCISLRDRGLL